MLLKKLAAVTFTAIIIGASGAALIASPALASTASRAAPQLSNVHWQGPYNTQGGCWSHESYWQNQYPSQSWWCEYDGPNSSYGTGWWVMTSF
jgi:hypothetical protein